MGGAQAERCAPPPSSCRFPHVPMVDLQPPSQMLQTHDFGLANCHADNNRTLVIIQPWISVIHPQFEVT
jgi:hypothetical protein